MADDKFEHGVQIGATGRADSWAHPLPPYGGNPHPVAITFHHRDQLDQQAQMAVNFVRDMLKSGARSTPPLLAQAACELVDALFKEFRDRDWIVETAHYGDIVKQVQEKVEAAKHQDVTQQRAQAAGSRAETE